MYPTPSLGLPGTELASRGSPLYRRGNWSLRGAQDGSKPLGSLWATGVWGLSKQRRAVVHRCPQWSIRCVWHGSLWQCLALKPSIGPQKPATHWDPWTAAVWRFSTRSESVQTQASCCCWVRVRPRWRIKQKGSSEISGKNEDAIGPGLRARSTISLSALFSPTKTFLPCFCLFFFSFLMYYSAGVGS